MVHCTFKANSQQTKESNNTIELEVFECVYLADSSFVFNHFSMVRRANERNTGNICFGTVIWIFATIEQHLVEINGKTFKMFQIYFTVCLFSFTEEKNERKTQTSKILAIICEGKDYRSTLAYIIEEMYRLWRARSRVRTYKRRQQKNHLTRHLLALL